MKRPMHVAAALGAALALVSLGACSSSGSTSGGSGSTTTTGAAAPASNVKYAVVLKALDSQFWQDMKKGIQDEATKQGVTVDVYAGASEDDTAGQVSLVENAISKGYAGIAVAPISPVNLNNAVAQATKAGIRVVNIDEQIDVKNLTSLGGAIQAFISSDNVKIGNMAGQEIVDTIKSGEVAIIEGKAGDQSGADRETGAVQAFQQAGLTVDAKQPGNWDSTTAYNVAQDYISKYPNLKAIYACNDVMAMGAEKAVQNSGKDIKVVGTDGDADAIASVKAGGMLATVKQDSANIGAQGLDLLIKDVTSATAIDPSNANVQQARVNPILITKTS